MFTEETGYPGTQKSCLAHGLFPMVEHSARSAGWLHAEAQMSCASSAAFRQGHDVLRKSPIAAAIVVHPCLLDTTPRRDVVRPCAASRAAEAGDAVRHLERLQRVGRLAERTSEWSPHPTGCSMSWQRSSILPRPASAAGDGERQH